MVATCVAYGCRNIHKAKHPLTFHSFPFKRPEVLELWVKAIKRDNWRPTKASRLCGAHFLKTDFYSLPNTKRIVLNVNAVPSIFSAPGGPIRKGGKRALISVTEPSEEATNNVGDNKKPKEELKEEPRKEPIPDDILINKLHEEDENELSTVDIEHNNDIHQPEVLDDTEVILEYNYDNKDAESPPRTQIDSCTEEPMDENSIFELSSTSTDKSTSLPTNALNKTFADVAVLTTENYNTVEQLKRQVRQLHQIIRRQNLKIACLEEVIKELCETDYEKS